MSNTNKKDLLRFLEPMITVIFWLLLFASPLFFGNSDDGIDWTHIIKVWIIFIPYLVLFLLNRFVLLPYLFFRSKRLLYFASCIVMILILSASVHLYETRFNPSHNPLIENELRPPGKFGPPDGEPPGLKPEHHPRPPNAGAEALPPPKHLPPFLSFLVISVLIVGFDTGLMISMRWAQSEQKRIHAEKENAETKLAFLRNQVSPHFLMNTLNNIHSLMDYDTKEAKESIIKLSRLMRHLLYDSQEENIPLAKEIDFIKNYVELMRLRYSEKVRIDLSLPEVMPDKSVPPLLFTSFVENAFKHGISSQEESFIEIIFNYIPGTLTFKIRNSNPHNSDENEASGIGVGNSRDRLDLLYGERFTLNIEETEKIFIVNLTIPV